MRPGSALAALCVLCLTLLHAQAPAAKDNHASFEVAAIKPTDPGDRNQGYHSNGRQIFIENESVLSLVMFAYGVHKKQIVDGPPWIEQCFDIHGTADLGGEPTLEQYQSMVQQLLTERFSLTFHRDRRELPVYTITVAKGGSKLVPSTATTNPDQTGNGGARGQTMRYTNNNMDDFALGMQYFMDRPVVNRTGLTGRYNFTLEWNPRTVSNPDTTAFPDMFTAVQEQLGLKLTPVKDQVDAIVIDKLERPSAN